jgi:hypothetical protein
MVFKKINTVYTDNHMKSINILCGEKFTITGYD